MQAITSIDNHIGRVYFYPHGYLRDHQLDTIREWPKDEAVNPEIAEGRTGSQVSRERALSGRADLSWKRRLPLINVKRRPKGLANDITVYTWGAILATGRFIVDLENPYALVGYNPRAMSLWRPVLQAVLSSQRCVEIHCLSQACRNGVFKLFGPRVAAKSRVVYPRLPVPAHRPRPLAPEGPRFLFVGTQFEIKGGAALLRAFPRVRALVPSATLDLVTHLPRAYEELARQRGVAVHDASFSRDEVWDKFLRHGDVLVHPSFVESFGLVVLEAMAHGLAIVATDVYAMREMVTEGQNGYLLKPPVRYWEDDLAGPLFRDFAHAREIIASTDTVELERELVAAMLKVSRSGRRLLSMRHASLELFRSRFSEWR